MEGSGSRPISVNFDVFYLVQFHMLDISSIIPIKLNFLFITYIYHVHRRFVVSHTIFRGNVGVAYSKTLAFTQLLSVYDALVSL